MSKLNLKGDAGFWSAIGLVLVFVLLTWFGDLVRQGISPELTSAATSSAVTVSATVATTISCSVSTTTTEFGTLTAAAITTSTPQVSSTMACSNSGLGCTLSIGDTGSSTAGGLYASAVDSLIKSPDAALNATATLSVGVEGYGIQATTTGNGSGQSLAVSKQYAWATSTSIFGGLTSTSTLTLASSTASSTGWAVIVTHGASISDSTKGGTYADTITYSCVAN